MRLSGIVALAAILTPLSLPALAIEELTPEPARLYRVTGVGTGDVLNVRVQPDPSSEIVGTLEPNARDIVTIDENGIIRWNDREWASLSAVARAITGGHWSGPAFFGLRKALRDAGKPNARGSSASAKARAIHESSAT